jgi:DNA topoisomerase-1
MKLLIVESPAKAKTISKYLDGKYVVKASVGHIRDLPKSNKKAIDIEGGFIPHYEISKGKEKVVAEIQELADKADEILLATDPDREGEAIAWHIAEATKLKKPRRVVFHEITKDAVQEAILHPRDIDDNLKQAQEARRVLDRLVGYDLSGLIWKKVRYGLSAGRVQSPALRILVEREREIKAFIPETFWVLSADLETSKQEKLTVICDEEPRDKKLVDNIVELAKKNNWEVKEVKETEVKRSPKAPFTTSTLQQAASSRLGFAPSRTMGIAQKLYEAGHITYMRTDSTTISKVALDQIASLVQKSYGKEYYETHVFASKSKNAQEAHEGIRPTDFSKDSVGHNDEQKKLYQLIWRRTVASQMADAKTLRTKITTSFSDEVPTFSANGSRILFDGWLKVDPEARQDDIELPKVVAAEPLKLLDLKTEEKQTEPPSRYSEAGLVKELEKRGIGRPSTYAAIIKTILDRGYVEKIDRALKPTETGMVVSTFLEKNFMEYINDSFTAEMEDKLDGIANGEKEYIKVLKDFYGPFQRDVKARSKSAEKITDIGPVSDEFKCPVCGSPMVWKLSKNGKFMSCSRFPECTGARTDTGRVMEGPKETGEKCPLCNVGMLIEREGRFGKFISCNRYPKCKFIKKDLELEKQNSTGIKCNICNIGEMVQKKGRFGVFYGCSNYPDCKNILKTKPTGNFCPLCQSMMIEGTKTIPERCSNKTCPNHNPHKLNKVQ